MPDSILRSLKHLQNADFGKYPEEEDKAILHLAEPMVESFNYAMNLGLQSAITDILPVELMTATKQHITITITNVLVGKPCHVSGLQHIEDHRLFPRQCLESGITYNAPLTCTIGWTIDNKRMPYIEYGMGRLPIMVKSNLCNLVHPTRMNPTQLAARGEEVNDPGGYFICNGTKRVLRLLTAYRRNYPIAMTRETWRHRQQGLTDKGVLIQCVARDETSTHNILHYLNNGFARIEFVVRKNPFLVDLAMMLKALADVSDYEIIKKLTALRGHDTFFIDKVKEMLLNMQQQGLHSSLQCREFIGRSFRPMLLHLVPEWFSDLQVCNLLLDQHMFIHLSSHEDKFSLLCVVACKLYSYVAGDCVAESLDVTSMQEVHLSGFLYLRFLKDRLQQFLTTVKYATMIKLKTEPIDYMLTEVDMRRILSKGRRVGADLEALINTGNLNSVSGCGLMQTTGLSVMLEGLNRMRDMSHLRALHRGSYFLTMKTVLPRRLTGEAWGFICPVHTPDGNPCGLLNHIAYNCCIPAHPAPPYTTDSNGTTLVQFLVQLGMTPLKGSLPLAADAAGAHYPVLVDGKLVGTVKQGEAAQIVFKLRKMKTTNQIYKYTELVLVPQRPYGGQFPGLFIFTSPARLMRPVVNLSAAATEYIGSFEQVYLDIAITVDDVKRGIHTHLELDKIQMFSNIANLVPFSDCNPIPRNMYQCQMAKQTMGTPLHNWRAQAYNKLYRLTYPQVPLVRNAHYDKIHIEDHCMGFNVVLAIVSYTGYDIEDAMVINKASMERGLAHGHVYKSEYVNLAQLNSGRGRRPGTTEVIIVFRRKPNDSNIEDFLDDQGLPYLGTKLTAGNPYYCTYDLRSREYRVVRYKGENAIVDKISMLDRTAGDKELQLICITLRTQRYPDIGDKFASRSGQKGIMSRLYPAEDLPFTDRGIMPDIIFNPHGIPSRMTAGKLLELIAGKAAAEYALSFDSTPFEFNDENPAADYFGSLLEKAGFNYYGEDEMYSGIDGRLMPVKVYQGIMYYQRLKHMTDDKYQVRSTGAVDTVTHQPIKGRKRGGAIRFGEMERDALIAHGAVFTLRDRLLDCSDAAMMWLCRKCGDLLAPRPLKQVGIRSSSDPVCSLCGEESGGMVRVQMPYAWKYMAAELASLGIAVKMELKER